jgi:hypothetical protein
MKGTAKWHFSILAWLVLFLTMPGLAQTQYQLWPTDGYSWQDFGFDVAIDGADAIVGACPPWDYSSWEGSAFIFHWNGASWGTPQKIVAPDHFPKDEFGARVAIQNGRAVVGCSRMNGTGAAYVFEESNREFVFTAKLVPSDAGARFMCAVALDGDYIITGDHINMVDNIRCGAAYIFHRNSSDVWEQQAKLVASDPLQAAESGYSVGISGERAVVGENNFGVAYVYKRNGEQWTQEAKISSPEPGSRGQFGLAVSIDNDMLAIGAPTLANPNSEMGAVYLYQLVGNAWVYQTRLVSELTDGGQGFGSKVSLSNNRLLIGAHQYLMSKPGAAYLYHRAVSGWELENKFVPSDGRAGDYFGGAVSTDGANAFIGAYRNSKQATWSGTAYIYPLSTLNAPPIANAGGDIEKEGTTYAGAWVTLHGEQSYDPELQPLTYNWAAPEGILLDDPHSATPSAWFPYGSTNVLLTVNDGELNSPPDQVKVEVTDTTPPTVTVTVSPTLLWPANHKMDNINATVSVIDNQDRNPLVILQSISSDEPDDAAGNGDGNTINDIQGANIGTADFTFQLRAERDGNRIGRTYTVVYQATDQHTGLTSTGQAIIFVPHDQGQLNKEMVTLDQTVPTCFALQQNYPNPFNPSTQISFQLPTVQAVLLSIYNSQGQLVRTLIDESMNPGTHSVPWDGLDQSGQQVAAGLYVYILRTGEFSATRKMLYLR